MCVMFKKIKKAGMKWATSPQAMKVMTNPNVQKALMKALQLPTEVRTAVQERTRKFADFADLATRNDVQAFVRTIRDLERDVQKLKRELDSEKAKNAAKASAPMPGSPVAAEVAPPPSAEPAAAAPEGPKKTKIISKKKAEAN